MNEGGSNCDSVSRAFGALSFWEEKHRVLGHAYLAVAADFRLKSLLSAGKGDADDQVLKARSQLESLRQDIALQLKDSASAALHADVAAMELVSAACGEHANATGHADDTKSASEVRRAFAALSLKEEQQALFGRAHLVLAAKSRYQEVSPGPGIPPTTPEAIEANKQRWDLEQELIRVLEEDASVELRNDREAMLFAISVDGLHFCRCGEKLRGDLDVALAAVRRMAEAWHSATEELLESREATIEACKVNGSLLPTLDSDQQDDKEIVLAAVSSQCHSLLAASERLKADREVVLAALAAQGPMMGTCSILGEASPELRGDREIVLAEVSSRIGALQSASEALQGDREIVLAALRTQTRQDVLRQARYEDEDNRNIFLWASEDLRDDEELVLEAMRVDGAAIVLASLRLRQSQDFLLKAARCAPEDERDMCYNKADTCVHESVDLKDFMGACESVLAMEGDSCPVLTITLISTENPEQGSPRAITGCDVSLVSEASFTCNFSHAGAARDEPPSDSAKTSGGSQQESPSHHDDGGHNSPSTVAELATILLAELPKRLPRLQAEKPPERIFMVFMKSGDSENPVSVTPWDWNRPLLDFH